MTVSEIRLFSVPKPTRNKSDHVLCFSHSVYFVDLEHGGCHETSLLTSACSKPTIKTLEKRTLMFV